MLWWDNLQPHKNTIRYNTFWNDTGGDTYVHAYFSLMLQKKFKFLLCEPLSNGEVRMRGAIPLLSYMFQYGA